MNIWALDKHQDIRHVLLLLETQLGEKAFVIDTETACDPRSVFLRHHSDVGVHAWLHTLGQEPGCYAVHLEYPYAVETQENVSLPALVQMLAVHFDVALIHPLP